MDEQVLPSGSKSSEGPRAGAPAPVKKRPRLLLVDGASGLTPGVIQALAAHFDIVSARPEEAADRLREVGADAVIASPKSLAPVDYALAMGRAGDLLNSIGGGVCLCTSAGRIVWSSDHFRQYDEGTQRRVADAAKMAARAFDAALRDGRAAPQRVVNISTSDDSRFLEVVLSPVIDARGDGAADGAAPQVAAVVWDVTHARRTQQKIDAIDRAGRELIGIEADVVRRMNMTERLRMLQDKIVRYAHELLNFDHFAIRLLDRESNRLEIVMAFGLSPDAMDVDLYATPEGNGISGYVASTGRSYICPDAGKDPRYVHGLEQCGSSLTTPLLLQDRVIGTFNVESQQKGAFTEDDRQFAEIFARYIAMALHMLDMLVVERVSTNETLRGTVQGELAGPLEDLEREAEWLRAFQRQADPESAGHIGRILRDVDAIRKRMADVTGGPQTVLGADQAISEGRLDPLLKGRRILVADNEEGIRDTIGDVLRRRGCEVEVFPDGARAIERIEELRSAHEAGRLRALSFDLVISDIKMPDRNGYEVFAAAKRLDPSLPVVLMTGFGYDPHHSIVRASQEGLQCVLFKPFQVERLLDEVRKALAPR